MRNQLTRHSANGFFGESDFFGFAPVFERFFEEPRDLEGQSKRTVHSAAVLTPACDITENDHAFLVSLDMPGVAKDDIKMEAVNNRLVVTAERRGESKEKEGKWHMTERGFGRYQRAFTLGNTVDTERIEAAYGDGVLRITLPKAEAAKPRQIKIDSVQEKLSSH